MKKIIISLACWLLAIGSWAQSNENSATAADFGTLYVQKGQTVEVAIAITNTGTKAIRSFSYIIANGENATAEKIVSARNLAVNETREYKIAFETGDEAGRRVRTFTITKVNGAENSASHGSATGIFFVITEKAPVTPLVEEFTGTWCGWCPIGFDAMEEASEWYRDKVALIAVHCSDVMEVDDFSEIAQRAPYYPSAIVDRGQDFYPSSGDMSGQIDKSMRNKIATGVIEVSAEWTDESKTEIKIDTKTRFVISTDNGNYAIGFALTQDGMTGTGSSWAQANNLSGNSSYADSNPYWYKAASRVTGVTYNHVGVAVWGLVRGINGSVNPVIRADEEQLYTYNANISKKTKIQDKSKLKVIAILIDRESGTVVNAAQTKISEEPTGIISQESRVESQESIYDLSGRKISNPKPQTSRRGYISRMERRSW